MKKENSSPQNCFQINNTKHNFLTANLSLQDESFVKQIIELFLNVKSDEDSNINMVSIEEKILEEYQRIDDGLDNSGILEGILECIGRMLEVLYLTVSQKRTYFPLYLDKMEQPVMDLLDKYAQLTQKYLEIEEIAQTESKEVKVLTLKNEKLYEELSYVLKREQSSEEKYEEERNFKIDEINEIVKELSEKEQQNGNKLISSIKFLEKQLNNHEERKSELEVQNNHLKISLNEREGQIHALKEENQRILQELNQQKQYYQQREPNSSLKLAIENQFLFEETQKEYNSQLQPSCCEDSITNKGKEKKYPLIKDNDECLSYRNSFPKAKKILSFNKDIGVKFEEKRRSNDNLLNTLDNEAIIESKNEKVPFNKKSPQPSLYRINSLSSLCSTSSKPKISETLKANLEESTYLQNNKSIGLIKKLNEEFEVKEKHLFHNFSNNEQNLSLGSQESPSNHSRKNKNEMIESYAHLHTSTSTCSNEIPIEEIKKPQRSTYVKSTHEIENKETGVGSSIHGFVSSLVTMRTHKRKNQKNFEEEIKKEENLTRNRLSKSTANTDHKNNGTKETENEGEKKINLIYKNASVRKDMRKNQTIGQISSNHKEKKTYEEPTAGLPKNMGSGIFTGIFDIVTKRTKK